MPGCGRIPEAVWEYAMADQPPPHGAPGAIGGAINGAVNFGFGIFDQYGGGAVQAHVDAAAHAQFVAPLLRRAIKIGKAHHDPRDLFYGVGQRKTQSSVGIRG